jgi:peptidoglycan/LPS O-acetylase OafA/YrhL
LGVQDDRVWNSFFLQYLWEFVLGMYLAKKLTEKPEFYSRFSIYKLLLLAVLFLAGSLLITFYGGPTIRVYNDFLLLPAYGFLAVFVYKLMLKPVNWFFNFTGEISYSLFLWHMLFLNLTVYLLGKSLVFLLISLLLTYLVSYAYNRWFVGKVLA